MSIERTGHHPAAQTPVDDTHAQDEVQMRRRQAHLHAARMHRGARFKHAMHAATPHNPASGEALLRKMTAAGVVHRRMPALQHGGRYTNQHGGAGGRGGRDGGGQKHQQQRQQQQRQQQEGRPGAQPQSNRNPAGDTAAATRFAASAPLGIDRSAAAPGSLRVRALPAAATDDKRRADTARGGPAWPGIDTPDTLRRLAAQLAGQSLLLADRMRAAWTEQCYRVGAQRRRWLAQTALTLDMLEARSRASEATAVPGESMQTVHQDLLDVIARVGAAAPPAPDDDALRSWNALLPLVVFSGRRPLSMSLVMRAQRRSRMLLRTLDAGGTVLPPEPAE